MPQASLAQSQQLLVVLTSLPNMEAAKSLACALVEKNMAACVQLLGGMHSIYRWEGKVCEESEILLSAKTIASNWLTISGFIKDQHPYDLPEILAFTPAEYEQQYGAWVQAEVISKQ